MNCNQKKKDVFFRSVPELSKNVLHKLKCRYVNISKHRMCQDFLTIKLTASRIDSIPLKNCCYCGQDFQKSTN